MYRAGLDAYASWPDGAGPPGLHIRGTAIAELRLHVGQHYLHDGCADLLRALWTYTLQARVLSMIDVIKDGLGFIRR